MTQEEKKMSAIKEQQRRERLVRGDTAERMMKKKIGFLAVLFMVIVPIAVCFGLRYIVMYVDNDLAVLYPTTAVTVLQWILYYLMQILMALFQYAGFGILGYSVLRYGVKNTLLPILLTIVSAAISFTSGIFEMVYVYGSGAVKNNLSYFVPLWVINYFLSLFTYLCVIFLCAMLRISFIRNGRLAVGITKEDRTAKQKNVLRRLYLYISVLILAFNLVSAGMSTFAEIREVGAPETFWDGFTLVQPYFELLLISVFGFIVQLLIGAYLTKTNRSVAETLKNTQKTTSENKQ